MHTKATTSASACLEASPPPSFRLGHLQTCLQLAEASCDPQTMGRRRFPELPGDGDVCETSFPLLQGSLPVHHPLDFMFP